MRKHIPLLLGFLFLLPQVVFAGSQTFISSGTFTVPAYGTLTVEMWGGGGGGGAASSGSSGYAGSAGGTTSFGAYLSASGGGGGGAHPSPSGGSGGSGSGGDTNSTGASGQSAPNTLTSAGAGGSSPNGGAGGAGGSGCTLSGASYGQVGTAPGGGGGGSSCFSGGGGGGGGYAIEQFSLGEISEGSSITVTVGTGGAGGSTVYGLNTGGLNAAAASLAGGAQYAKRGGAGASGKVIITWTDPPPALQCDGTPQTFSTPGTYTRTVPTYGSMVVEVWGGGASGLGINNWSTNVPANSGTQSSFGTVVAGGGFAGTDTTGGAGGTASGGDTNQNLTGGAGKNAYGSFCPGPPGAGAGGSSPNGGAGGQEVTLLHPGNAGFEPGGGGSGASLIVYQQVQRLYYCRIVSGGGAGAYSKKTYSAGAPGALSSGSTINVVVGSGGAAGSSSSNLAGGAGAAGQVKVTCSSVSDPCPTAIDATPDTFGFKLFGGILTRKINRHNISTCISNSGGLNYFIPAKTAAELQSFISAIARLSGVTQQ